ncbi:TraB/GumN family protein [Ignatzschineria sp. LJL83]
MVFQKNSLVIKYGLWVLLALLLLCLGPSKAQENSEENAFLWTIQYNNRDVGTLLGTVHIGSENATLSSEAKRLLDQSHTLVTENTVLFKKDAHFQEVYAKAIINSFKPSTETLEERFGSEYAKAIQDILISYGVVSVYQQDRMSNEFIMMLMLAKVGGDYHEIYGAEKLLQNYLSERKIKNIGLEKVEQTLNLYVEAAKPVSKFMIEALVDNQAELQMLLQSLITSYEKKDIVGFLDGLEQLDEIGSFTESQQRLKDENYHQTLIVDRNKDWIEILQPLLKQADNKDQPYFIAVGAMHLFGEEGMVQLLEANGFKLLPIAEY